MDDDDDLTAALDGEAEAAAESEIDRIDPPSEFLELASGDEVRVLPLRTRQLFKLLRIITHGAGQALLRADLDFSENPEVFLQKLLTLVAFSIPDAEQETIEFLQSMVEPTDLVDKATRDLSDKERQHNIDAWTALNTELWNPDPMDTLSIIENVVRRESADLQALGKRIRGFLELANKTGQLKSNGSGRSQESVELPAPSPGPSTSSRTSTAGKTRSSSPSRSAASAKSPRPSRSGTGKTSAARGR